MHQTFFTSLGITAPPGREREPFRVRLRPVLTRDNNAQKETLMRFKKHHPSSLPLNIRLKGPAEALEEEWSFEAAWGELIRQVEAELNEQTLRYNLSISEKPSLEWSWHDEASRGGMECTILVHIHTGTKGVSLQKRKHLHWIALDPMSSLNNEVAFTVPVHNLLMKTGAVDTTHQELRNRSASFQASPQATRKKRLTRLDMTILMNPEVDNLVSAQEDPKEGSEGSKLPPVISTSHPGSISHLAARNRLTYV
jgi:hypothetical protein